MKYTYIVASIFGQTNHTSLTYLTHLVELLGSHHIPTLGEGALRDDPGMAWDAAPATSPQGDGGPNGHRHLQPQEQPWCARDVGGIP